MQLRSGTPSWDFYRDYHNHNLFLSCGEIVVFFFCVFCYATCGMRTSVARLARNHSCTASNKKYEEYAMLKRAMEASPTNFSQLLHYLMILIMKLLTYPSVTPGITLGTEENRAIGNQPTQTMQRRNHEPPPLQHSLWNPSYPFHGAWCWS